MGWNIFFCALSWFFRHSTGNPWLTIVCLASIWSPNWNKKRDDLDPTFRWSPRWQWQWFQLIQVERQSEPPENSTQQPTGYSSRCLSFPSPSDFYLQGMVEMDLGRRGGRVSPCLFSFSCSRLNCLPPPTKTSNPPGEKAWKQDSAWVSMHQVLEMGAEDGMSRLSRAEALSDLGTSFPGQMLMCASLKKIRRWADSPSEDRSLHLKKPWFKVLLSNTLFFEMFHLIYPVKILG